MYILFLRWTTWDLGCGGESFDKNGDEKVEEDVVAERHQSDEVQSGPRRRLRHALVQNLVPVLLRQYLQNTEPVTPSGEYQYSNKCLWKKSNLDLNTKQDQA